MIDQVSFQGTLLLHPHKGLAGTPNVAGAIASLLFDYLDRLDMDGGQT